MAEGGAPWLGCVAGSEWRVCLWVGVWGGRGLRRSSVGLVAEGGTSAGLRDIFVETESERASDYS